MAKFTFAGMEEYNKKLRKLSAGATGTIKRAVYVAADIVADEIRKGVDGLQTSRSGDAYQGWRLSEAIRITPMQKAGLQESLGLSHMRNERGYIYTKAGFSGYNGVKTTHWPKGQPNAMIARSCERGSSAMLRQPFVAPALRRASQRAEKEMAQFLDEECEKTMK